MIQKTTIIIFMLYIKYIVFSHKLIMKNLVIVESPSKAKTIESYLGKDFKIIASYGHICDLAAKSGSIDTNDNYKMRWELTTRGKKQVDEMKKLIKDSDVLYLATDPDREGEAISWHVVNALKKEISHKEVKRVVFHEITKNAVQEAFKQARDIDQNLVDSYLARRALDYLFGFSISPVLWRKMPGAKSAGRVQSVALRLIVEREIEIHNFKPQEYWSIHGDFLSNGATISANLVEYDGEKIKKLDIKNGESATSIIENIKNARYKIESISKKQVKKSPAAPFTTSTLQQDAVRKLGFSSKKTMQIAQKLYEGINIGGSTTGLITYMRTDSVTLSNDAVDGIRGYIQRHYPKEYMPNKPRIYKTKSKNAQEAHEAIRPTDFNKTPQEISGYLSEDEYKLYELIWLRTIACQMENAIIDQVGIDISSDKCVFRATGSTIAFDGFLRIYSESKDEKDEEHKLLPKMNEGDEASLQDIKKNQHFTQAPPRYNEASLVKTLEELGIGRPSTYASIINVLQIRKYVALQKKNFMTQNISYLAISFLKHYFATYLEYDFTAKMEEDLDDIAQGEQGWLNVIDDFWKRLNNAIDETSNLRVADVIDTIEKDIGQFLFTDDSDRKCPNCENGELHLKFSRFGSFLGCSNYPDCNYVRQIGKSKEEDSNDEGEAKKQTSKELGQDTRTNANDIIILKHGPYGPYFEWSDAKDAKNPKKPKRLPVPKFIKDLDTLTVEDAIMLDSLPKILGQYNGTDVILSNGRYGPFTKYGSKNYKVPQNESFLKLDINDVIKIIESE